MERKIVQAKLRKEIKEGKKVFYLDTMFHSLCLYRCYFVKLAIFLQVLFCHIGYVFTGVILSHWLFFLLLLCCCIHYFFTGVMLFNSLYLYTCYTFNFTIFLSM